MTFSFLVVRQFVSTQSSLLTGQMQQQIGHLGDQLVCLSVVLISQPVSWLAIWPVGQLVLRCLGIHLSCA